MFEFGKNWISYAKNSLDEVKVEQAREAFHDLVNYEELKDKKFLDIGFGQGLILFFAQEAGAKVYGIDIDRDNIEAVNYTARFFKTKLRPKIEVASIMNNEFINREISHGGFDVVYSWGVLHHTGNMYHALSNAIKLVKAGGLLIISIYKYHWTSPIWRFIKWTYNKSPLFLKKLIISLFYPIIYTAKLCVTRKNPKEKNRGMDFYHNVIDWVGGYPYEYAHAEKIIDFIEKRDFKLLKFKSAEVPTGCNEFVFRKSNNISEE